MSTQVERDLLDLEKLRSEIAKLTDDIHTEYACRHNWEQQERNWIEQAEFWRAQERVWQWQTWLLFGTFVLGVLGIVSRVIWP